MNHNGQTPVRNSLANAVVMICMYFFMNWWIGSSLTKIAAGSKPT